VTLRQQQDLIHRKRGCPHERVQPSDRLASRQVAPEVICRACGCGDGNTRDGGDLVIVETLVARDDARRRPGVIPDQLDRYVVVDPLGSVESRGCDAGHHTLAARPQPRAVDSVQQRRPISVGNIDVPEHPVVPPTQIVFSDHTIRKCLAADDELPHASMLTAGTDKLSL
jgi:hypothetical protein